MATSFSNNARCILRPRAFSPLVLQRTDSGGSIRRSGRVQGRSVRRSVTCPPGWRWRCDARRHFGARADADRRFPSDGQGSEFPRACERSGLCRARFQPGGDVGPCGQSWRFCCAGQESRRLSARMVQQASALSAASQANAAQASALSAMALNSRRLSRSWQSIRKLFSALASNACGFRGTRQPSGGLRGHGGKCRRVRKYSNNLAAFKDAALKRQRPGDGGG